METKTTYQEQIEAQLKDVEAEIRRLQARHNEPDDELNLEDDHLAALQAQQATAREKLQALTEADNLVWEQLTTEVEHAVNELKILLASIKVDLGIKQSTNGR